MKLRCIYIYMYNNYQQYINQPFSSKNHSVAYFSVNTILFEDKFYVRSIGIFNQERFSYFSLTPEECQNSFNSPIILNIFKKHSQQFNIKMYFTY